MEQPAPFDDYDPRAWLERSALLFLQHQSFAASIEVFSRLIHIEPAYSMAWYGLSNALIGYSGETRDIALLRDAVAYAKHAMTLDPTNQFAQDLVHNTATRTPLTTEDIDAIQPITAVSPALREHTHYTDSTLAAALDAFSSSGERMQIIMWLGALEDPSAVEILVRGLSDTDSHVRMATLKRLAPEDGRDTRIRHAIVSLAKSEESASTEPYLSMALKRFTSKEGHDNQWAIDALVDLERKGS